VKPSSNGAERRDDVAVLDDRGGSTADARRPPTTAPSRRPSRRRDTDETVPDVMMMNAVSSPDRCVLRERDVAPTSGSR